MIYDKRFKLKVISQFKDEALSINEIAEKEFMPRQTLTRWIKLYNRFGEIGLENRKPGTKEIPIKEEYQKVVLDAWKKMKRSAYRMRIDLKLNGNDIPEGQINKIYKKGRLHFKPP